MTLIGDLFYLGIALGIKEYFSCRIVALICNYDGAIMIINYNLSQLIYLSHKKESFLLHCKT